MKKVKEYLEGLKPQFDVLEHKDGEISLVKRLMDGKNFKIGNNLPLYYHQITSEEVTGLTAAVSISQHISYFFSDCINVYLVTEVHVAYFKNQEDRNWLRNMELMTYASSVVLTPINDIENELKKFRSDFDILMSNKEIVNWFNNYRGESLNLQHEKS